MQGTAEHRWLAEHLGGGMDIQARPACEQPTCDIRVEVLVDSEPYYVFRVGVNGSLLVEEPGGAVVAHGLWAQKEQLVLAELDVVIRRLEKRISKLPEFLAFSKQSRAQGASPVMWLESLPPRGCTAASPSCAFQFYVGELMADHANRWATFRIARHGEGMSVSSLDSPEPMPYAAWRRAKH